jgi:heme oxygenase (biliverdin-IX-beta and delta-forming)
MANPPVDPKETHAAAIADVKRLLRLARTGALATLEAQGGAPLTTLLGVASDFDGAPLFLMSTLSRHTRNLADDPRASLLLTGRHERGDPLNQPRVTLGGLIERCAAPRAKVRYLQRNPKAGLYAGFADFAVYALRIEDVHFNGGFGRAAPLTVAEVLASREGETALVAAEKGLLAEVNALGQAQLARLAGRKVSPRAPGPGGWRAVGLDGEGLDLAAGGRAARAQFAAPAHDTEAWRARLDHVIAAS